MNQSNGQIKAKVDMIFGGNYTWMRNNVLQGEQPAFGFNLGTGIIVEPSPKWKRVSFGLNFLFSKKGYKQSLGQEYEVKLFYLSSQWLVNYKISQPVTSYAGFDLSGLISTSVTHGLDTYRNGDFGLVFGFLFFENKPLTLNAQLVYGLTPLLDYYKIDQLGNLTSFNDLRNTCISLGVRYRIVK
jgi:hypothetical protein